MKYLTADIKFMNGLEDFNKPMKPAYSIVYHEFDDGSIIELIPAKSVRSKNFVLVYKDLTEKMATKILLSNATNKKVSWDNPVMSILINTLNYGVLK